MSQILRLMVRFASTFFLLCVITFESSSQCPISAFQAFSGGNPPCGAFTQGNIGSGTYATFSVVANASYTFSTCGTSFDTQISGYTAGNNFIAGFYNDDNGPDCGGTAASINWTSTLTGQIRVMVNRWNCQGHDFTGVSAVLKYRQNPPVLSAVSNTLCGGGQTTITANQILGAWSIVAGGGTLSGTADNSRIYTAPNANQTNTIRYSIGQCTQDIDITSFASPTVTLVGSTIICSGIPTILEAQAAAGSGSITNFNFLRNGISVQSGLNNTYNATQAGNYSVVVTQNAGGCTATSNTLVLDFFQSPTVSISGTSTTICQGQSSTITANATAGTGFITNYNFLRNGVSVQSGSNNTFSATLAGDYTVIVTQSGGSCTGTSNTFSLNVNAVPSVFITGAANICQGAAVLLSTSASAGSGSITNYQWQQNGNNIIGANSPTYSVTQQGIYTVVVTNSNNCSATSPSVTINVSQNPFVFVDGDSFYCQGSSTILTATAFAGSGTITTYQWKQGGGNIGTNSSTLNVNFQGSYTVVVTNSFGCSTESAPITVLEKPNPSVSATSINPTCFGLQNGSATALPSGGQSPYTYAWSNTNPTQTTQIATGLGIGTYHVTITDIFGCSAVSNDVTLTTPPELFITPVDSGDASCAGVNDGFVEVAGSVGTPPYLYSLNGSPFQPSGRFNNLSAGVYTATVQDALGCQKSTVITLDNLTTVLLSVDSIRNISCNGANDGYFSLVALNGISPYSYSTDGIFFQQSHEFFNVTPGNYNVLVKDAAGCQAVTGLVVTQPPVLAITMNAVINSSCAGNADGSINLTVTGGTLPYTYSWSNGDTTEDLSGIGAGIYNLTVVDANNCSATISATITEPLPLSVGLASIRNVSCFGKSDGEIDISVSGGIPPYSFNWSNGKTTEDNLQIPAGTYSVTVADANGCSDSLSYNVTEPDLISISLSVTDVVCSGDNSGSIDVTVSGGITPYTFLWSNFSTSQNLSNVTSGSYTVIVTDATACSVSGNASINALSNITINTDLQNVSCNGQGDGSIELTVSGGIAPYDFIWSDNSTNEDLTGLSGGNYSVTVSDSLGCSKSETYTIIEPLPIFLSVAGQVNVSCAGGQNGSIDITVGGGFLPYSFLWSDNSTNEDLNGVSAGNYGVTVTDISGCSDSLSFTITEPTPLNLTFATTDVVCSGDNSGNIDLTVTGGVSPYSYLWSNFSVTQNQNNVQGGNYFVVVTDNHGCTVSGNTTVNSVSDIQATAVITNVSCFGQNDGAIAVTVNGGIPPLTFSWSNGASSQNITSLSGGTYTLFITDSIGCADTSVFVVAEPPALFLNLAGQINASCFGKNDGSIDISVAGGNPPYSFLWSDNSTSEDLHNVIAGTYSVTVSDNLGCSDSSTFNITEPDDLIVAAVNTAVTCAGDSTGSISLNVSGGVQPYTYLWSTGAVTADLPNLVAGTYIFTVTDFNSCIKTGASVITNVSNITINESVENVSCFGENDGSISLNVSGGVLPYTFIWSTGSVNQNVFDLTSGSYSVTITDDANCTQIRNYTITEPARLQATASVTNITTCSGLGAGNINLVVVGGVTPYSFIWSNGATSEDLTGLDGGIYAVTVTDANFCSDTLTVALTEPSPLSIQSTISNVSCNGGSDASLLLTILGGAPPYSYNWSNGATSQFLLNIQSGSYAVTVTDNNGCVADTSFTINQPTSLTTSISYVNVTCNNGNDGSINLTVNGGAAPYTYLWSNFSTTQDLFFIKAGAYTVLVTDDNGCLTTDTVTISEPSAITVTSSVDNDNCFGLSQGAIDITTSGGTPGYTFLWSTGATTEDLSNVNAGSYTITVTDAVNCSATFSFNITQPDSLVMTASVTHPRCNDFNDGAIDVTISGGSGGFTYLWSNGATTQDLTGLSGGIFTLTATDASGCILVDSFAVNEPLAFTTLITTDSVRCHGESSGAVNLTVTGGTLPYTYLWSTFQFSKNLTGVPVGNYAVIITDFNGCIATDSTIVSGPQPLIVNSNAKGLICGAVTGDVEVAVTGGTAPYSFLWSNGATTQNLTNVGSGTYTLTVTDARMCATGISQAVNPPPGPIVQFYAENVCFGEIMEFDNRTVIASGGIDSVRWFFGDNTTSRDRDPVHTYLLPGTYTVTLIAHSDRQCVDTFIRQVIVYELPDAFITADPPGAVICDYDSVLLSIDEGTDYIYLWSTNDTASEIHVNETGVYLVTVTNNFGCTSTDEINVTAFDPLSITITPDTIVSKGQVITLNVGGGVAFEWSPAESLDDAFSAAPNARPVVATLYSVTVTDINGCVAVATVNVEVRDDYTFNPPNLFTPNGDGSNDTWIIRNIDVYPGCEVGMYNRWGSEIFKTKNYQNDWDGTERGRPLPDGTYYYIIRCPESNIVQKGAVTILR